MKKDVIKKCCVFIDFDLELFILIQHRYRYDLLLCLL